MRSRKPMTFETIPEWAIDASERSRYTVAAAFELAGLTDKYVRLTAESQRAVFGVAMFGKCSIRVGTEGIGAYRSVCFGTDVSGIIMTWDDVERHMKNQTKPCI